MAKNTKPIYSGEADPQWSGIITAANTAKDGTGTLGSTIFQVFEADTGFGGFLQRIRAKSAGTNVASVARFFLNNGGANSTPANNALIGELGLPAITNSESTAQADLDCPFNFPLPPDYRILVTLGTGVASGWIFTAIAGKYQPA